MKELKSYLWTQWSTCNHPKYYRYFELWFNNLTNVQLDYFIAYMNGKKSPLTL